MVLRKIGETVTDIVVNGTNRGSFTQSQNSTYNINVSQADSYDSTRIAKIDGSGEKATSGSFSSAGRVRIYGRGSGDYNVEVIAKINGNSVISFVRSDETRERVVNVEAGDTYELSIYAASGDYGEAKLFKSQNTVKVEDMDGSSLYVPAGVTVESVNKS